MKILEVILKMFGSAWGAWSIVAFAFGIFFWIMSAVIKKAKLSQLTRDQTYRFFRLAMLLAFFLAVATMVMAATKEVLTRPAVSKEEKIQQLTLNLKSDDPTVRRQAIEGLVSYGGDAARELVKAISDEAGVVASEITGRAVGGDLIDIFLGLLGMPPWQTPFMGAATVCLVRIGKPSVPHILDQLAAESEEAELLWAEAAQRQAPQQNLTLVDSVEHWGFLVGAAGQGMRIAIAREIFSGALLEIGEPAVPDLLDALESPRILVRLTSYQVLTQIPSAAAPTIQRLRQMAARSNSDAERDHFQAAIELIETQGR